MKKAYSIISIMMMASMALGQTIYYVDGGVGTSGDGTSWGSAFKTVQEGIDAAANSLTSPSSQKAEVWVKKGTYYIYQTSTDNTVSMKEGVYIYGGFAGTESNMGDRDIEANPTILDGHQSAGSTNRVKHVVSALGGTTAWTNGLIDGFTITGGKISTGPPTKSTGGISATDPSSILESGDEMSGAGVLIFKSAPMVSNCKIKENEAGKGAGIYIMSATESPATSAVPQALIYDCEIRDNTASMRGGGISIDLYSEPIIKRCKIINNNCDAKGGGVYIDWVCPRPVFVNCLIADNTASRAGGMGCDGSSSPYLINCTVTGNTTTDIGAGLYTGSYNPDGTNTNEPILINCIVAGNSADWGGPVDLRVWHDDYFHVSHSALGTGFSSFGEGVSYTLPTFLDANNGNYALASGSMAIDAGVASDALDSLGLIPSTDLNGYARDASPDLGCFEFGVDSVVVVDTTDVTNDSTDVPDTTDVNDTTNVVLYGPMDDLVKLYPNPVGERMYIEVPGQEAYQFVLYNNTGLALLRRNYTGNQEIDLSMMQSGVYYVRIINKDNAYSKVVLIE